MGVDQLGVPETEITPNYQQRIQTGLLFPNNSSGIQRHKGLSYQTRWVERQVVNTSVCTVATTGPSWQIRTRTHNAKKHTHMHTRLLRDLSCGNTEWLYTLYSHHMRCLGNYYYRQSIVIIIEIILHLLLTSCDVTIQSMALEQNLSCRNMTVSQ